MSRKLINRSIVCLVLVFSFLLILVTGCGSTTPATTPAQAPVSTPTPTVDKASVLKQAAVDYFTNIPDSYNMIDAPGLQARLAEQGKISLVDIRQANDFMVGHIPGAINIPFQDLGKKFDTLPKDKQIVIYCYTGQSASMAAALLKINGFDVLSLSNGYPEWEKNKFPVAKGL
ncbi:rhodanese-like domain-containing protein [Desulfosporosinus sp. BG]|uniref:rhodanese-like domain-containing protein n=1 Tax=Desulfosporosinus sp. BG TaxID=1633135 RepID=UPI00083B5770|nr:rhodanese-like domain-containing protein [Desulfosporosinus sp. BG]ODA40023.1 Transcriptional regulator, ArsR family [Desulfosporosinus sp. BG]